MKGCRNTNPSLPQRSKTSTRNQPGAVFQGCRDTNEGTKATIEDVVTPSNLCHDIENSKAKIVPTFEDVVTSKLVCRNTEA
ncbi:hypothetical protein PVK06_035813 [Gossypium arboreum]|uniref:Uncharacterized protein n=1 Tax=Gossypium arboreum TaxID=29729 RepID=A0ABR0NHU0_GOSAR|nr:hypothetical protein PVK06_035813 [Gossypium arboreum]